MRDLDLSGSVTEPPAFVAGLDDIAVVCEAVEECGGHLRITKDAGPFAEGEVGGDVNRGPLIEPADQVEEELTASLGEGQIAEFVEDNKDKPRRVDLALILPPEMAAERHPSRHRNFQTVTGSTFKPALCNAIGYGFVVHTGLQPIS